MRILVVCTLLSAATAFGADVNGKWSGSVRWDEGGEERKAPISLTLKQDGSTVSGITSGEQGDIDIKNGKFEADQLSFDITPDFGPIKFKLTLAGSKLSGEGILNHESGAIVPLQIEVQRKGESAGLSGKWTGRGDYTIEGNSDSVPLTMVIKQEGSSVSGSVDAHNGSYPMKNTKYENSRLTFDLDQDDGPVKCEIDVKDAEMTGTAIKTMGDGTKLPVKLFLKREQ